MVRAISQEVGKGRGTGGLCLLHSTVVGLAYLRRPFVCVCFLSPVGIGWLLAKDFGQPPRPAPGMGKGREMIVYGSVYLFY